MIFCVETKCFILHCLNILFCAVAKFRIILFVRLMLVVLFFLLPICKFDLLCGEKIYILYLGGV